MMISHIIPWIIKVSGNEIQRSGTVQIQKQILSHWNISFANYTIHDEKNIKRL